MQRSARRMNCACDSHRDTTENRHGPENSTYSRAQRRTSTKPGRFAALGQEAVDRIVKTIAVFDDFCHANDPYEEHDFGSFEAEGHTIFFKIDYFDRNLKYLSPDPTDPVVTARVITIMLADEY
jgi:hypothetical protein